jgi:hypothetical protein
MPDAPRFAIPMRPTLRPIVAGAIRQRAIEYEATVASKPPRQRRSSYSRAQLKIAADLREIAERIEAHD